MSLFFVFFTQKESVCCCNTLISHKKVTTQCSTRSHCYFSHSSPLIGYLFLIQLVGPESKNLGQPSAAFAWNGGHLLDATGKTNKPSDGTAK